MKKGTSRKKYTITAAIGLIIAAAVTAIQGGFSAEEQKAVYSAFCDGCFVAGALLTGAGLLAFVADDGLFDMLNYGVQKVARLVLSEKRREAYPKTFIEFKEIKNASRKGGSGFIVITGLCWIAVSVILLLLYMA